MSTPPTPSSDVDALTPPRVIGGLGAFSVVAGAMLGVGIFLFPSQIAQAVPDLTTFFGVWLLGGLFALAGSVACGELGAMMPRAGGDYVFQREALGPSVAFASGWVLFAAIFSGSIASMAVAVFQYQVSSLAGVDLTAPVLGPFSGAQLLAIGLIVALTAVNAAGTRVSTRAQTVLTLLPFAALIALGAYILFMAPAPPKTAEAAAVADKIGATTFTLEGLVTGFLLVNFAFSGWINIIYVASEVKDPGRTIPRAMIGATGAITALYIFLCLAFVSVLGLGGLSALGWTDAGTGTANALGSQTMATLVLVIIAVAIVTSVNATILASARVAYAMGQDGALSAWAGKLSPKRRVPTRALWLQCGLATALVLSGSFEAIIEMTSIAMFVTGALTVTSLFVLRRRRPQWERPYRASLYPWLPGLYIALALVAIVAKVGGALGAGAADGTGWFPLIGLAVVFIAFGGHTLLRQRSAKGS